MNQMINIAQANNLSPEEKRALLIKLMQRKEKKSIITAPLSPIQQSFWSLYQMSPQGWAYNVLFSAKIISPIDLSAFKRSIQILVDRHESLRTNYTIEDGVPCQKIHPDREFKLEEIDISSWQKAELDDRVKEIIQRPFDLENEPVIRVSLLNKSTTERILLLVVHHIAIDLWGLIVLLDELRQIYQAQSLGLPLPLPPVKSQYLDYMRWQSTMLEGERGKNLQQYWQHKLAGELPTIDLPLDRPRPPIQTFAGSSQTFSLDERITKKLRALAQKEAVSLYTVLLSALNILFSRYSGQEDILIGSTAACRNGRQFTEVVGACLNPIVLRGDLTGDPSFIALLARMRDTVLEALQHQEYPFQILTRQLQITPDLSRSPVFQVMFLLQKLHRSEDLTEFIIPIASETSIDFGGLKLQPYPLAHQEGNHDMMLEAIETEGIIKFILKYNPLLFEPETITRTVEHFKTLIENILANPQQPISSFSLLTDRERQQLSQRRNLIQPNNSFIEFPQSEIEQSISARFQQQVRQYPDRLAVETQNYCWTYEELERQVDRIAKKILSLLPNSETRIALFLEHDAPAIAAILAVLKTGNTYVPIDPNYPQERVIYLLEDSLASLVLTNRQNLDRVRDLTGEKLPILDIDTIEASESNVEIDREIKPDTIAYLLYTSGSTGKPKGVMQNHRNVLHFIKNYTNNLHIDPSDRLSLLASYSFDAALMDIFGALLNGATLCPFDIRQDGLQNLSQWLKERKITIYHSTPTVFRSFVDIYRNHDRPKNSLEQIRLVVLGGEEVVRKDVELYQKFFPEHCLFVNGLGPTESTVTLQYFIDKQTENNRNKIPVGYPVEDTKILLLDSKGIPTDLVGEIAIESPHVALGYWRKPELTSAAFASDLENSNCRIYRTGDWGRWRADGSLEFLGRKDSQVKIRGLRIELGEIEAILTAHPAIKDAIVLIKENSSQNKYLVAYLISQTELIPTIQELKNYLTQRLPKYTIPSTYLFLDAFPISPNGKIQRSLFPTPKLDRSSSAKQKIAPRNDLERQLASIWQKILHVPEIGIEDDFFELGGNSLSVILTIAEIEKYLDRKIPINTFLELSTISRLAVAIDRVLNDYDRVTTTEFVTDKDIKDDFPQLTPKEKDSLLASTITKKRALGTKSLIMLEKEGNSTQKKPLFFVYLLGDAGKHLPDDRTVYNLTVWATVEKPETFVKALAAHYVREIRTIQPEGPYYLAGYCLGGFIALEIAKQLQMQGEIVAHLSLVQTKSPDPTYQRRQGMLLKYGYDRWLRLAIKWRELQDKNNLLDRFNYLQTKLRAKLGWSKNKASTENNSEAPQVTNKPDYEAYETEVKQSLRQAIQFYKIEPYSGDVTLFFAKEGTIVSFLYPDGGWSKLLTGKVDIDLLSGNHTGIVKEPNAAILIRKIICFCDR
jgi:amino acid adenylation domain-containing protein